MKSPAVLFVSLLYFAIIIVVSYLSYHKANNISGFIVGGRSLGVWMVSSSIMAAIMSGWTWIGMSGGGYGVGYPDHIRTMAFAYPGIVLGFYLVAKPIRVISERTNSYTLPDVLAARFGESRTIRLFSAGIILIASFLYLSANWVSMGYTFSTALGTSYQAGLLAGAAFVAVYMILGGAIASAWTSFFQLFIMVVMSAIGIVMSLRAVGGYTELNLEIARVAPEAAKLFLKDPASPYYPTASVSYLLLSLLFFSGLPAMTTKFMTIKDTKSLKWCPLIAVVAYIVGTSTNLVGLAGRVLAERGIVNPPQRADQIIFAMMGTVFPPLVSALLYTAILSAIMSTCETYLLLFASSVVNDFAVKTLAMPLSEKRQLFWTRAMIAVCTAVTFLLAFQPPALISLLGTQAFGAFLCGFGAITILGMRWRRANKQGAVAGIASAFVVGAILPMVDAYLPDVTLLPGWNLCGIGAVISLLVMIAVSLLTPAPEKPDFFDRMRAEGAAAREEPEEPESLPAPQ